MPLEYVRSLSGVSLVIPYYHMVSDSQCAARQPSVPLQNDRRVYVGRGISSSVISSP